MEAPSGLHGHVAVITGGGSGIGLGTARALGRRGCRVMIASRDFNRVAAAAASIPGAIGFGGCDVADPDSIERLFAATLDAFGPPDILVASAGLGRSPRAKGRMPTPLMNLPAEEFDDVFHANFKGVFLASRRAAQLMLEQGSGQIVNVSSARAGKRGYAFASEYCASKHAVTALSRAMAAELAPLGIRVVTLLPDMVATPMIEGTQLGKDGTMSPDDVGEFVATLLEQPRDLFFEDPVLLPRGTLAATAARAAEASRQP